MLFTRHKEGRSFEKNCSGRLGGSTPPGPSIPARSRF
jgi:hypothetical protein